ncbi:MAG: thioesterase [Streptomycetaceae bacterium]|nr:thioesterase [Streptomycetaceae bacterium]
MTTNQTPGLLRPLNEFADAPDRPYLVCLPYAGGADRVFRTWAAPLAAAGVGLLAARLPGRAERVTETPYTDLDSLVADLADATSARLAARDFALYGHSMGAAVASALTLELDRRALAPTRLFVGAHAAPRAARPWLGPAAATDGEFLSWLGQLGLVDPAILANDELVSLVLPGLRADFTLVRAYQARPHPRLPVPISVFGGRSDPLVDAAALGAWAEATDERPVVRVFPGGHLFPWEHPDRFVRTLVDDVAACFAGPFAADPSGADAAHPADA